MRLTGNISVCELEKDDCSYFMYKKQNKRVIVCVGLLEYLICTGYVKTERLID